jgi:hypothetical protein
MLTAHLRLYVPDEDLWATAEELSQCEQVRQLLQRELTPSQIDHLAARLADVVRGACTLELLLCDLDQAEQQQTEQWFRDHPSLELRAFRVAVAALSGSRYVSVRTCATDLIDQLHRFSGSTEPPPSQLPFSRTRTELLAELGARVIPGEIQTEYGSTPTELLELVDPTARLATLHYVWREYADLRICLLAWLRDIASHTDSGVRVSAAAAVGALAILDFDLVLEQVLRPWAKASSTQTRVLCAVAASVAISDERLAPELLRLLHHWATLEHEELGWTAAAAYGCGVGAEFPYQAVRDLLRLAEYGGSVFQIVLAAFQQIIVLGVERPVHYDAVLSGLTEALSNPTSEKTVPLLIALNLARLIHQPGTDPESEQESTFLWMVRSNVHRRHVFELFREALNSQPLRAIALETIQHWLVQGEIHRETYSGVRTLLYLLVVNGLEREQLRLIEFANRFVARGQYPRSERILELLRASAPGPGVLA